MAYSEFAYSAAERASAQRQMDDLARSQRQHAEYVARNEKTAEEQFRENQRSSRKGWERSRFDAIREEAEDVVETPRALLPKP